MRFTFDRSRCRGYCLVFVILGSLDISLSSCVHAEDWPEWRGKHRLGVWNETDLIQEFPSETLKPVWEVEIFGGYAGPAVSGGKVFVTDFRRTGRGRGEERAVCVEERSGKILWSHGWPVRYQGLRYDAGPRATPTVDNDRVYVLGAMGNLACLGTDTGEIVWEIDYVKRYGTEVPIWGMSGAPLVHKDALICIVGGSEGAKVVAFDKKTGKELWRSLADTTEPGYSAPVVFDVDGRHQLIIWHGGAVSSLNPETGHPVWEVPFLVRMGLAVATPIRNGSNLFVSAFYEGPLMLALDEKKPGARIRWKGKSTSETRTDGLHCLISTPVLHDGYLYGVDSYGELRCLNAQTGERVWETLEATEKARWASAFIIKNGDRYILNNDRGDLIFAHLTPEGYQEISRSLLIEPTTKGGGRREKKFVNWTHPAFANGHVLTRNDEKLVRVSLRK